MSRFTPKIHIRKNDMVFVRSGDDKGKKGRVLEVLVSEGKAFVEGINIVSKHTKPNSKNTQGGIVKKEAAIAVSKLSLLDPKTNAPARVGRKNENGKNVRYSIGSKASGEIIK